MSAFFGLTSTYRQLLFTQINQLVYHGGGGFIHSEVYNMPIWMRLYHLKTINKFLKDQSEEQQKHNEQTQQDNSNKIVGPNVKPSSTYSFKK